MRTLLLASVIAIAGCGARTGIPELLSHHDAGHVADGGVDAATIDAWRPDTGVDAPPPCLTDVDCDDGVDCTHDTCGREGCMHTTDDTRCDDGLYCDGVETCSFAGCVMGTTRCGDGIDCTHDACDEMRDACTYTPDDALCPLSNICDPVHGCEPRLLAQDPTSIYSIALPSGDVTRIARTDLPLTDIALTGDGTYYGATTTRGLVRVDPAGGTPMLIGNTGHPCIFGLAVYRDTLYGLTCDGLVLQIDPTTAASTVMSRTMIEFDGGAAR